jgi:hypothetical protein
MPVRYIDESGSVRVVLGIDQNLVDFVVRTRGWNMNAVQRPLPDVRTLFLCARVQEL